MVDEAAAVLEAVAEDSWVIWGMRVLPNVVAQVRAEGGEGSEFTSKALELLFAVEAEKDADEDIACQEVHHQEKLEAFLDERIIRGILKETQRWWRGVRQRGTRRLWRWRLRYQGRWMWTVGSVKSELRYPIIQAIRSQWESQDLPTLDNQYHVTDDTASQEQGYNTCVLNQG